VFRGVCHRRFSPAGDIQLPSVNRAVVPGRAQTMPHDYKRHDTTTLFAALNVLTGHVIGSCLPRHRHEEFLRFLRTIDREVPKGLAVHMILDNYATHKHPEVKAWLPRGRRVPHYRRAERVGPSRQPAEVRAGAARVVAVPARRRARRRGRPEAADPGGSRRTPLRR